MPYIGNKYEIGDHNNSWKPLDDISSYVATFDGSATNAVSTTNNTIRVPEHRFIQGQRVTYSNGGGGNIGGLTSGTAYYIIHDTNNEFKLATSLSNANASTAINISAVGSGSSHTVTAAFDGVNKKFKITYSGGRSSRFTSATQLTVAINNIVQRANDTTTFTDGFGISDNEKIVFNVAPVAADIFWGNILSASLPTFDISDNKLDNFTGNGSATDFTLSHIPANNESIIVTVNGVVQHPTDKNGTRAYSLDASVLVFTAAPANGDEIQVRHIGFAGASSSAVTGFYGRTGNVTLSSSADNAIVGVITATQFSGPIVAGAGTSNIVAGILTVTKAHVGGGTTWGEDLVVTGNARVTGILTVGTNSVTITGNDVNITGVTTASNFKTGTSNLHSAGVEVAGVNVLGADTPIGLGATIYNSGAAVFTGVVTATTFKGNIVSTAATFTGPVTIGGTLTYEDVTNVDAVGIVTARAGVHIPDNQKLLLGTNTGPNDGEIYSSGSHVYFQARTSGQTLRLTADDVYIRNRPDGQTMARFDADGAVDLYYNTSPKFATTNTGVTIAGIPVATQTTGNVGLELHAIGSGRGSQTKYHNDHGEAYIGQAGDTTGELLIHNTTASNINIATGNANRIKIAGNSAAISIGGAMTFNAMLTVQGDVSGQLLNLKAAENTTRLMVAGTDSNGVEVNLYDGAGGQKGILGVSGSEFFIKAPNNSAPLTFYTHNGSSIGERLRITSGGYLGLGTNNPDTFAHFKGTGNTNVTLTLEQGTTAGNVSGIKVGRTDGSGNIRMTTAVGGGIPVSGVAGIMFGSTDTNLPAIGFQTPNSSNGHIVFSPKGSERFRIDSSGRLQLGNINGNTQWGQDLVNIESGGDAGISIGRLEGGSPTNGQQLGSYSFQSAIGSQNAGSAEAKITAFAAENQSGSTAATDMSFWVKASGTGPGSAPSERMRIDSTGRVIFNPANGDYTNPDIGGSTAGVTINKNTTGQIYAATDAGGSAASNDGTSTVLNLCRRNGAGDGPQLALDRGGWIKASLAGLVGSNTANGGPGQFAVYTHDYNSGTNVRKEQLRILNNGTIYVGRDGVGARMYTDGSSGSMYLQSGNGRQTFRIYDMASGQSHTTHLDATGQLGIGIAPAEKLHLYHASNDPFIKIQRDTTSNVSTGGIKFASGASGGIFATMGSRVTSNSGEKGCVYIQTQDGSGVTREPWRATGHSGGQGSRLTSQGNSVCVFGSDQTHGGQFIDGRPDSNNVYEHSQSGYRNNSNGMYGGTFVVTGTGGSAATTWYPVWFSLHTKFPQVLTLGKYVHNYGSWDGQFMFRADISGTGYGAYGALHRVTHHTTSAKNFIGRIVFTSHNNAYLVLWLLGGGRSYHWGTIGGGIQQVNVGDDGNNHNLGPGNNSEGPITSSDTMDYGYEPNMNDSPSHQQTGFT